MENHKNQETERIAQQQETIQQIVMQAQVQQAQLANEYQKTIKDMQGDLDLTKKLHQALLKEMQQELDLNKKHQHSLEEIKRKLKNMQLELFKSQQASIHVS